MIETSDNGRSFIAELEGKDQNDRRVGENAKRVGLRKERVAWEKLDPREKKISGTLNISYEGPAGRWQDPIPLDFEVRYKE